MKAARFLILINPLYAAVVVTWLAGCTTSIGTLQISSAISPTVSVTAMSDSAANLTPAVDTTATAAALIIAQALAEMPTTPTVVPVASAATPEPTDNEPTDIKPIVVPTSASQQIAAAVAATLTGQPTTTPTTTSTVPPTDTPDLAATQTADARQIATSVMATLVARPTATAIPIPTATPTPYLKIQNFTTCLEPCQGDGGNARRTFPEGTKKVYLTWVFRDFPIGADYTRVWTLAGKGEWARYECTWPGPESGIENLTLSIPGGIHSGTWEVAITIDQEVVLREQIVVEGDWDLWDVPGLFTTCYGKR